MHYKRWLAYGDANRDRPTWVERFWLKVDKTVDCWDWTGAKAAGKWPYGVFTQEGTTRAQRATHAAWKIASGEPVPPGFFVLHTCDRPPCVRNDDAGTYEINGTIRPRYGHLWVGTAADNTADMINKGRGGSNQGGEACIHGHPFTPANTRADVRNGSRICRTCNRLRARAARQEVPRAGDIVLV